MRHPFWSRQPVFFYHDLHGWLAPGKVIHPDGVPAITRYTDGTVEIGPSSIEGCKKIARLLGENYSSHANFEYRPSTSDLAINLMDHGTIASYAGNSDRLAGCITCCKARCRLGDRAFDVGYVDNLCVAKQMRGKGVAEKLIQATAYHCCSKNTFSVLAFKREGSYAPFVPLVCVRSTATWAPLNVEHTDAIHRVDVVGALALLEVCLKRRTYSCSMTATTITLEAMLTGSVIEVLASGNGDVFVFRNMDVRGGPPVIQCVAAFKAPATRKEHFRKTYAAAVEAVSPEKYILIVEGLGDLAELQSWSETVSAPIEVSTSAYYLYNYVERPHKCDKVVCIV